MISAISVRQITTIIGLGIAAIIGVICAIVIFKRDPHYNANRFTSLAYLNLTIAFFINVIYVLINIEEVVAFLHRIANLFGIIAIIFLFLSAMYLSEGEKSLRSSRMMIIVVNVLLGLGILFSPGVKVFTGETALPGSEQYIEWDVLFFLFATIPMYFTLSATCYYYLKVWREIPSNTPAKNACSLIIIGTILLGFSHFLIVIPHMLRTLITEISTLVLIANFGSIGVLVGILLVFWGYRTTISGKNSSI
ncbi:MAG: hypothetical protein JSW11_01605 [Candidatus Heimdallarchaeota archaeon]|nr:MAG: hypothetical protein JSW11_01605 [Candidatus Heimdallarchaeota archaeon]